MSLSLSQPPVLIPGYTCAERLGAGGYGEVWKVEAPGGLQKAIKLIYGDIGEERASRELKALNRIKIVRHPYILSLERIEVVEKRLVIVTELADRSLMDRFRECTEADLPGVPRDELLRYLRDAAEALDYMLDHHSLQHLDIKPDNLLLLCDHVKVADFGLVKDVVDQTNTFIGGLTPVYAAPETFSGTASRHSDQYSLAVVYQQMLTGTLPFPGRNPAQLAVQHAKARPILTSLPASDREAAARALRKIPERRFPNCRAFVEALLEGPAQRGTPRTGTRRGGSQDELDTLTKNELPTEAVDKDGDGSALDPQHTHAQTVRQEIVAARRSAPVRKIRVSTKVSRLPPLREHGAAAQVRPTLFVGIGGTGAEVLAKLKPRLDAWCPNRYDDAVQMLLLDTDRDTIQAAARGELGAALRAEDLVTLAIRRTEEYRNESAKRLAWLSRRWLYNIPASLKTQGFRPLGRLAWTDHAERVENVFLDRLRHLISQEAVQSLQEDTGLPCSSPAPRVFLFGSISGGTAGGMFLDVAVSIQRLMLEQGVPTDGICVVLTHSTSRRLMDADLARANAYAALRELRHFSCQSAGDRHGEEVNQAASWPFSASYLVCLGDHLSKEQYDERTDALAEYLYCNSATVAGSLLDHCRKLAQGRNDADDLQLRSLALSAVKCVNRDIIERCAKVLCQHVVKRWAESQVKASEAVAPSPAAKAQPGGKPNQGDPAEVEGFTLLVEGEPVDAVAKILEELGNCARTLFATEIIKSLQKKWSDEDPSARDQEEVLCLMRAKAATAAEQLRRLVNQRVGSVDGGQAKSPTSGDKGGDPSQPRVELSQLEEELRKHLPLFARHLSQQVVDAFCQDALDTPHADSNGPSVSAGLANCLWSLARSTITKASDELRGHGLVDDEVGVISDRIEETLNAAAVPLEGCGMQQRTIVITPQKSTVGSILSTDSRAIGDKANMVSGPVDKTVICCEAEQISLAQVAFMLIKDRPDIADAACRLQTRKDIAWSEIPTVVADEE